MKRNLLYVLMIGLTLIFTACPEEETVAPYAYFEVASTTVEVDQIITFNNLSEDTESVGWVFGDNNISTDWSPMHSYDEAGTYTVLLTAYNGSKKDQYELDIYVEENEVPLQACFSCNTSAEAGQSIQFYNCSEGADSYYWEFGDGYTSDESDPSHAFSENGNYTVTLTAYSGFSSDQATKTITISSDPVTVDPYNYNGIPDSYYYDYFLANFESGDDGFYTGSDETFSAEIANGHYVITNSDTEYDQWFSNSGTCPSNSLDYQIEYTMKTSEYGEAYGSGIIWAMNDNWDHLFNIVSPFGGINMGYSDDVDGWISWSDWVTGGNESPDYNKITIRKYGSTFYVFRNQVFVYEHAANLEYGERFGVTAGPTQTIEFDEFTIKTIQSGKAKSTVKYKSSVTKTDTRQLIQQ